MDLHSLAASARPFTTVAPVRSGLRSLRRWCDKHGRDTASLVDDDVAQWVATSRASVVAIRVTLAALAFEYVRRGIPSPVGWRSDAACRQLETPRTRRPRLLASIH